MLLAQAAVTLIGTAALQRTASAQLLVVATLVYALYLTVGAVSARQQLDDSLPWLTAFAASIAGGWLCGSVAVRPDAPLIHASARLHTGSALSFLPISPTAAALMLPTLAVHVGLARTVGGHRWLLPKCGCVWAGAKAWVSGFAQ